VAGLAVAAAAAGRRNVSELVEFEHRGGEGTPLLLLHGITATFRVWEPVLGALEEHHDVIAPTLAGHHGAAGLDGGVAVSVGAFTDLVERRLDELEIERAHVAGNSLGGWIALELARRGRARSIVAFSPAAWWSSTRDLARVSLLVKAGHAAAGISGPRLRVLLARPRARKILLKLACERGERVPAAVAATMLAENAACTVLDDFLRSVWREGHLAGTVQAPGCPIRIAWPVTDRTIPFERYGRPLLGAVPAAVLVMLAGVGHVPMYDDPSLVARTILEVTGSVDGSREAARSGDVASSGAGASSGAAAARRRTAPSER
jgi:pimeloyl-ACP methyl ester carboxylesterase